MMQALMVLSKSLPQLQKKMVGLFIEGRKMMKDISLLLIL